MEEVLLEVAVVGYFSGLVVEFALAAHHIVLPLALVVASLLVLVLAPALALALVLVALELAAVLELLNHVDRLDLVQLERVALLGGLLQQRGRVYLELVLGWLQVELDRGLGRLADLACLDLAVCRLIAVEVDRIHVLHLVYGQSPAGLHLVGPIVLYLVRSIDLGLVGAVGLDLVGPIGGKRGAGDGLLVIGVVEYRGLVAGIVKDQTALHSGLILHLCHPVGREPSLHPSRGHILDYWLRRGLQSDQIGPDWRVASSVDDGQVILDWGSALDLLG